MKRENKMTKNNLTIFEKERRKLVKLTCDVRNPKEILRLLPFKKQSEIAERLGISQVAVSKWVSRFKKYGLIELDKRSSCNIWKVVKTEKWLSSLHGGQNEPKPQVRIHKRGIKFKLVSPPSKNCDLLTETPVNNWIRKEYKSKNCTFHITPKNLVLYFASSQYHRVATTSPKEIELEDKRLLIEYIKVAQWFAGYVGACIDISEWEWTSRPDIAIYNTKAQKKIPDYIRYEADKSKMVYPDCYEVFDIEHAKNAIENEVLESKADKILIAVKALLEPLNTFAVAMNQHNTLITELRAVTQAQARELEYIRDEREKLRTARKEIIKSVEEVI